MKTITVHDLKVFSVNSFGHKIYFRGIPIGQLTDDKAGIFIMVISDKYTQFPAGILLDCHSKYFRIKSPETGQILCMNYDECMAWSTMKMFMEDQLNSHFQHHPEEYTKDFKP